MRIPVTLLSGFLGAGKTTLVQRILNEEHGKKIALIENEISSVGIDGQFIEKKKELIVEMNNGCLCCSIQGDMVRILGELLKKKKDQFDYVLIEATGMADPSSIAKAFLGESFISKNFKLDSIITVVDAFHFAVNHRLYGFEFERQIVFANKIVLNKKDLCSYEYLEKRTKDIKSLNEKADIYLTEKSDLNIDNIFGNHYFDFGDIENDIPKGHKHNKEINPIAIEFEGVLNPGLFESFLNYTYSTHRELIIRGKGILNLIGLDERMLFQGVYEQVEFSLGKAWENDKRMNQIVFIGKNLNKEAILNGFRKCLMTEEEITMSLKK